MLHIGELLQEASLTLDSEPALLRWLAQQIDSPEVQSENQQLRLESDRHLVQVVTIHKSKGLEFPIVWLPFIGSYRLQNSRFIMTETVSMRFSISTIVTMRLSWQKRSALQMISACFTLRLRARFITVASGLHRCF